MKKIRLYMTIVVLALAGIMSTQLSAQVIRDADFNSIGRINGAAMLLGCSWWALRETA